MAEQNKKEWLARYEEQQALLARERQQMEAQAKERAQQFHDEAKDEDSERARQWAKEDQELQARAEENQRQRMAQFDDARPSPEPTAPEEGESWPDADDAREQIVSVLTAPVAPVNVENDLWIRHQALSMAVGLVSQGRIPLDDGGTFQFHDPVHLAQAFEFFLRGQ